MARRKRTEKKDDTGTIVRWTIAILCIATGCILALGAFGLAGIAGTAAFTVVFGTFGAGAYLLPFLIIAIGLSVMFAQLPVSLLTGAGLLIIFTAGLTFLGILSQTLGGTLGALCAAASVEFFGLAGAVVLLFALMIIGLIIVADMPAILKALFAFFLQLKNFLSGVKLGAQKSSPTADGYETVEASALEPAAAIADAGAHVDHEPTITVFSDTAAAKPTGAAIPNFDAEYHPPPLSLLGTDQGKPGVGDIKANANIIRRTFQNFGISVEMDEVSVGPTVTRYALKPAEGVRLSKIISLQNNLELALAAHPVRIEAPIPGKSLVGIEVPNATKAMVGLGGILSSPLWQESTKQLLAALGRDITGTPHYVNIAKMPHGLVAGATGSGKSVAIHAIITSLLYRNGPNQLRFIMVDPKRVELTLYNGIPHLLTPVITDPKKCIMALKWAAKEMDRRYNILEAEQVRDIESYHKSVFEPAKKSAKGGSASGGKGTADMPEALPYIVVVIDELADIMQSYPRELEAAIVRLAQMSRAVGIHLVLSTQRPSVNVITGLIKANVPTRMALQVSSQIDSRTILDTGGAEMLLGAGDMLYLSADMQKPVRIQTAYIAEGEVKKVVSYIKQHNAGSLGSLDLGTGTDGAPREANDAIMLADDDVDDDLYEQAKAAVEEAGRASTSYLQRKLRIGYSRAARLMDILEEKNVIGAADGSRPRDVLSQMPHAAEPAASEDAVF